MSLRAWHPLVLTTSSLVLLVAFAGGKSPASSEEITPGTPVLSAEVTGELRAWHRISLTFDGPQTAESALPNPFRDYRLDVTFSTSGKTVTVPGFYAADGRAGETGAAAGGKWRVHFMPDRPGEWEYRASFRTGPDVAVAPSPLAGQPAAFDGAAGSFWVEPSDKQGRDFRGRGLLTYEGGRYLRFSGTGEYFLKGGANSPENFLGYAGFDGTYARRSGPLHHYLPHVQDWREGDPDWGGGRAKGIIGALNYLAGRGMNSVYFLTLTAEGDGKDVWPWISDRERDRYDCSKLDQWEIVLQHMDTLGLSQHLVVQEQENDQLLDMGELGPFRRLYHRELVARFAHHPALIWNLGEENTNSDAQRRAFAHHFRELDPYDHPTVIHTYPNHQDRVYGPLLGSPSMEGASLQLGAAYQTHAETLKWLDRTAKAGRPWFVCLDEIGQARNGVYPDSVDPDHYDIRKYCLWGNLLAGGGGCEWYFGYGYKNDDLDCEDWRSRERMWDQTRIALEFFQQRLPFTRMQSADAVTPYRDDYCLAVPGELYVIYLPARIGGTIDLPNLPATYSVRWFDPRNGGEPQPGSVSSIQGPGRRSLGVPPRDPRLDWVVLVTREPT